MITHDYAAYDYEEMMIEKKQKISPMFFRGSESRNEMTALNLFRYVIENYLGWTPEQARDWLTKDVVNVMKLNVPLQYITFPDELNPDLDLFYVVWKIYPSTIHLRSSDMVLMCFKRALDGDSERLPKSFFDGAEGETRAIICLKYILQHNFHFGKVRDLYERFSRGDMNTVLNNFRLGGTNVLYREPVQYLHDTLASDGEEDELWYQYYMLFNPRNMKHIKRDATIQKRCQSREEQILKEEKI